jgi:hypothetical protein
MLADAPALFVVQAVGAEDLAFFLAEQILIVEVLQGGFADHHVFV